MPIRVGIDLVCTQEVEEALRVHGQRYLTRVYTDVEVEYCASNARRLAARFAAKEATMKALGRDDEALGWRSIGVRHDPGGRPSLELTGTALELARRRGLRGLSVSLTHDGSLAAAVVLADLADG